MDEAIQVATQGNMKLIAPYVAYSKSTIVELAAKEKAPLQMSYSCYKGNQRHCGVCATCIDRHEAFIRAGYEDPTEYSIEYEDPRETVILSPYPSI